MSDAVPDAGLVLLDNRRRRRRALLRVLLPLAGVVGIIGAIVGIAIYTFDANRRGALMLTEEILAALQARVEAQVQGFLDPMERVARISRVYLDPHELALDRQPDLEDYVRAVLAELPQAFQLLAADTDGNYVGAARGEAGGLVATRILGQPGARRMLRIRTDANGEETAREPMEDTRFEPRERPWFRAAAAQEDNAAWTDLYIFFTTRKPGVTVAAPVRRNGELHAVVAVDVALDALSEFLARLEVGSRGHAVIVDRLGRVVAHRDSAVIMEESPEGPRARRLDALGDPILARAYDRLRVQGAVRGIEEVDGERHVILARTLGDGTRGPGWRLVLTVPEADFTGFVNSTNRVSLLMSLGIVVLALGLALVLVVQGLRSDRAARRIARESAAIAAQSRAFAELAGSPATFDRAQPIPHAVTERLATATGAPRASLWRLSADGRRLICEDAFDAAQGGHTAGAELSRAFFALLARGQPVLAADAARERGLAELHRTWLHPLGSSGILLQPVEHEGRTLGAAWVEDPADTGEAAREFVAALARLLVPRLDQRVVEAAPAAARAAPTPGAVAPIRTASLSALLPEDIQADVYPAAAVLVARFSDPLALGRAAPEADGCTLLRRIADAAEAAAREAGVPYLALMADQLVAAAGLDAAEPREAAARRIAQFALALRDAASRILDEANLPPGFRIGLEVGVAIGSPIGDDSGAGFNLWGDAVRMADHLAVTAPEAAIQASEAFYGHVQEGFLFRPRGAFHMPRIGIQRSFVLAGEL
jgi:adenylate cyclase